MTLIGYLFWVICLAAVIFTFLNEKKLGTTPPYKTEHQALFEEITKIDRALVQE
ncbi:hypothetical protein ACFVRR_00030 [Gottfriedia sp. NPDC057948]|uniref:hypothetical protein n=1 Tax=Gottfriedia sp. NPDC057948 TaxID=3346287 RepID=UPI0036DC6170